MLSILDILKKYQEEKKKDRAETSAQPGTGPQGGELPGENKLVKNVSIFSVVNKDLSSDRFAQVKGFYTELLDWAKKVYRLEFILAADFKDHFTQLIDREITELGSESKELLQLCLSDYENSQDAFYYHVVNVSIISLELARGMGYAKEQLLTLGVAAFMHDIGSIKYLELISKSAKLTDAELQKVREHPAEGVAILRKIGGEFMPGIIEVISQEHERMDGSGYPNGIKDEKINESAQIIGLSDVYEAMTHMRPYRLKFSPPKAMNMILNKKNSFSPKILKVLLDMIGIFPVGTMVRLNTKEIGSVCRENQGLPLRPRVSVMFDEGGNKLPQPKQIDLSSNLLICVEECLDVAGDKAN